jgi:hypothetical protein
MKATSRRKCSRSWWRAFDSNPCLGRYEGRNSAQSGSLAGNHRPGGPSGGSAYAHSTIQSVCGQLKRYSGTQFVHKAAPHVRPVLTCAMDSAHVDDEADAARQPIRYELVPLPQAYSGNFWTKAPREPQPLVLEMGIEDEIRVLDPMTNAIIASTSLGQVTATPAQHRTGGGEYARHTDPLLVVAVPGLHPLRIRPSPMKYGIKYSQGSYRYTWRDIDGGAGRPAYADQPAYGVTEADWLGLVEKFGLSGSVIDEHASGELTRRDRRDMLVGLAWVVAFLLLIALAAFAKYGG